ncbi:MAG: TonB C-terminal domain-containing protein [Acidobacteriaceae bacterium]|nr:TonB C-terminal domain-containing protein [Acidobacteriaceae bacterium]
MPEAVEERGVELDLLRGLPQDRPRTQWIAILAASLCVHLLLFTLAVQMKSFTFRRLPERRIIVKYTPLYLPPDVLTQKAPNRQKLSKNIDLADLLAAPAQQESRAAPHRRIKEFELPKQILPRQVAKAPPQIVPEAPQIAINQTPGPLPPGVLGQLPPAPLPPQKESPFQSIGSDAPPNPHPTLKPPDAGIQSAIRSLAPSTAGRHLAINDDSSPEPMPNIPGSLGNAGGNHAAVELQSDPQGADFKPYLTRILAIVRANWKHVIPESARMGALRGRTTLEFIISRNGDIPKVVTAGSSGSEPLDRAAVAGLSMSNPLPPLPSEYKGLQVRLAFSFSYNMPSQ